MNFRMVFTKVRFVCFGLRPRKIFMTQNGHFVLILGIFGPFLRNFFNAEVARSQNKGNSYYKNLQSSKKYIETTLIRPKFLLQIPYLLWKFVARSSNVTPTYSIDTGKIWVLKQHSSYKFQTNINQR